MPSADVQPYYVGYAQLWTYQAFDIRLEKGWFHGRGVNDPKGNLLMAIHVSHLEPRGRLATILALFSSCCAAVKPCNGQQLTLCMHVRI